MFHILYFPHSIFFILNIFHTLYFSYSIFSILFIFILYFLCFIFHIFYTISKENETYECRFTIDHTYNLSSFGIPSSMLALMMLNLVLERSLEKINVIDNSNDIKLALYCIIIIYRWCLLMVTAHTIIVQKSKCQNLTGKKFQSKDPKTKRVIVDILWILKKEYKLDILTPKGKLCIP